MVNDNEPESRIDAIQLLSSNGKTIGYIDSISIRHGQLVVTGWALSSLVGLTSADQKIERAPHLPREDVADQIGHTDFPTPGFHLSMPDSLGYTVFWADVGGVRYAHPLPNVARLPNSAD